MSTAPAIRRPHIVAATEVVLPVTTPGQFNGTAIIDLIPSPAGTAKIQPGELLVRADGYLILITPKTQPRSDRRSPRSPVLPQTPGSNITGKQRPDGVLVAEQRRSSAKIVPHSEDKLRTKSNTTPRRLIPRPSRAVPANIFWVKRKKIPPYNDPAMQARIDRIGASLIPAYQRNLPDSDATKINFRFQLIDQPKWHDAVTLPNGIILVPRQVVERLQNDSQLATVLADNIACALEKQTFREIPAARKMTAAKLASDAGGFFVPGLGLATDAANCKAAATIRRHAEEQSGRVSLVFFTTPVTTSTKPLAHGGCSRLKSRRTSARSTCRSAPLISIPSSGEPRITNL